MGITIGYECVFKNVSLSHGKKSPTLGVFKFLAATHLVILFFFLYVSHNNTYILIISVVLISGQFLLFKNEWCEIVPKICIILWSERETTIYLF